MTREELLRAGLAYLNAEWGRTVATYGLANALSTFGAADAQAQFTRMFIDHLAPPTPVPYAGETPLENQWFLKGREASECQRLGVTTVAQLLKMDTQRVKGVKTREGLLKVQQMLIDGRLYDVAATHAWPEEPHQLRDYREFKDASIKTP